MKKPIQKDPERPKRIGANYQKLAGHFDNIQQNYVDEAAKAGWARDTCKDYACQFGDATDQPSFGYTEMGLNSFTEYVKKKEKQAQKIHLDITSPLITVSTSSAISNIIVLGSIGRPSDLKLMEPPPWWTHENTKQLAERLGKVRPGLGDLLLSAWESFHSQSHEPERAALGSVRELFNQFFEVIAPDKKVRASKFFVKKKGESPDKIHRRERLKYAANIRVKDKESTKLLDAQIDVVLQAYEDLNKLHSRGKLSRDDTRKAIAAIQSFIEQFVNSLSF